MPLNPAIYIAIFLPLFFLFLQNKKNKKTVVKNILKRKNRGESVLMLELAKKFIDKKCYIYTLNDTFSGVITEVTDNAVLVETKSTTDLVNLDFIIRISEIKEKKK